MKTYKVYEIFYSLQGEGIRAGTANLFLRFSGCNQKCTAEVHGFDCDTAFAGGRSLSLAEIVKELREANADCHWVTLTGGEPALQKRTADEVKYVLGYGQELPHTVVKADYQLISPAFTGSRPAPKALEWCIRLVENNPGWRLTLQMHKFWSIR